MTKISLLKRVKLVLNKRDITVWVGRWKKGVWYAILREELIITLNNRCSSSIFSVQIWKQRPFCCRSWHAKHFIFQVDHLKVLELVSMGEKVNSLWQCGFRRFAWEEERGASWSRVEKHWRKKVSPKVTHIDFRKTEIALTEFDKLKKNPFSFETSYDTCVLKGCFVYFIVQCCVWFCYGHAQ